MQVEINILQGTDCVTGCNIVLMIEDIGAISCRPNAGGFCLLSPSVNFYSSYVIKWNKVFYKGKMIEASKITKKRQKYNGELLYNVLMEEHNKMSVNNMIVETLDPSRQGL